MAILPNYEDLDIISNFLVLDRKIQITSDKIKGERKTPKIISFKEEYKEIIVKQGSTLQEESNGNSDSSLPNNGDININNISNFQVKYLTSIKTGFHNSFMVSSYPSDDKLAEKFWNLIWNLNIRMK